MATQAQINDARKCMTAIANGLDAMNWRYKRNDSDFTLEFGILGVSVKRIAVLIKLHPGIEVVEFYFNTEIAIPASQYAVLAIATCYLNNRLTVGGFECSVDDETVCYKISADYCESYPGRETVRQTMEIGADMLERYSDYFRKLGQKTMTLEQFVAVTDA